ncbi:MAG: Tim44-like domain-containing protein [Endozoicomonas sp. (ex Botrylloides leachii)]|nr:Tim44-like domain-containing protein [Endozoicomonas sp. (ex Botrylloides leachii)]
MKRFGSILCMVMAMMMAFAPVAEAKRMGGGRSMGKTYKTAPAPIKSHPYSNNAVQQNKNTEQRTTSGREQATPQQKSSRWGMLGSAVAGLAAGGLLASLFGGGSFNGMQGLDFILIALLALSAFFFFRRLKRNNTHSASNIDSQPHYSTATAPNNLVDKPFMKGEHDRATEKVTNATDADYEQRLPNASSGIIDGSNVPENLPGGFDQQAFLEGAREHYITLQKAWNENNLELIREYLSPELFEQLRIDRGKLKGNQHTEVLFVDAGIVRADYTARVAQVSIKYTGRYKDETEGVEEDINDIWHLERDITNTDAPWLIVGME